MKHLLLLLCFYCTANAQEPHCKLTPKDVAGKWQLVAKTVGFTEKGIEYANSTEFVIFTATTFTYTKDGNAVKTGTYVLERSLEGCLFNMGKKTSKAISINAEGHLTVSDYADDAEVRHYKKVE